MPLPFPRLDDRTFEQLVADAKALIPQLCPAWTDLSANDPGVTLVELFAFLTETLLYRVNRAPDKLRVNLLNLVGLARRPPAAAVVDLEFQRAGAEGTIAIPAGAQVASAEGIVFTVVQAATLASEAQSVQARALNCALVEGELLGRLDGPQGMAFKVLHPPIIAPSGEGPDVIVGVEVTGEHPLEPGAPTRAFDGATYRIWDEGSTAEAAAGARVYLLDRAEGVIRFPPQAARTDEPRARRSIAHGPASSGPQVRVWYRTGGGRAGDVARDTLSVLKAGPAGVQVRNPLPATGGADAETIEAALERAPLEVASHEAAVTARDYERIARSVSGAPWARALAQAAQWSHGTPGVVDVLLMPPITAAEVAQLPERRISPEEVRARRVAAAPILERVEHALRARRPLGVRTTVDWAQVLRVSVDVRVAADDPQQDGLAARLRARLNDLFSPLRDIPPGRTLNASDVYEALLSEPGVRYIEPPRMRVVEAPQTDVQDVIRDPHQPNTWFVASTLGVHRTLDDGESWSRVYPSPPRKTSAAPVDATAERAVFVRRHRQTPGLLAVGLGSAKGGAPCSVRVSTDCGETWLDQAAAFEQRIFDADWITRAGAPVLLVASETGLHEFSPGHPPRPVKVDVAIDGKGAYAVATSQSATGSLSVAVAASGRGGVFVSRLGGVSDSFEKAGLDGKDIRVLLIEATDARDRLWAGASASGGAEGEGVFALPLDGGGPPVAYAAGWKGGSCEGLALAGRVLFAGSNRGGFLRLDTSLAAPSWSTAKLSSGLPLSPQSEDERAHNIAREFAIISGIAADRWNDDPGSVIAFAVGPQGVFRYRAQGADAFADGWHFDLASRAEFGDRVPLPRNWLYCSGEHTVSLISDLEDDNAA